MTKPVSIFKTEPKAHQREQFNRHKDDEYFGLFDDMGTGKSKIAIDICAYNYQKGTINACLLIAPNNVHMEWIKTEFPKHCAVPYRPFIWRSLKINSTLWRQQLKDFLIAEVPLLKVFAVNIEAMQHDTIIEYLAEFVKHHNVFIIMDEGTRIKHGTAKRSKVAHKLNKYGRRCILTGTGGTEPFGIWSMMEFLKANYFECNFFMFQHRYGVMMKGSNQQGKHYTTLIDKKTYEIVLHKIKKTKEMRNGDLMPADYEFIAAQMGLTEKNVYFIEAHPEFTQFKDLDKLRAIIAKNVSFIRKEDCLDLPPKIYEKLIVNLSEDQRKVYRSLVAELHAQYDGTELSVTNKVALTTRLMQVTGGFFPYAKEVHKIIGKEHYTELMPETKPIGATNPKIQALLDDLEEVNDDTHIVVWGHFKAELKALYAELKKKYTCCLYFGETAQNERSQIITDFQKGQYRIFIGNAATAGFGLNLQIATVHYFFSNTFRTEDRLQAEDRSHRMGVKGSVVYKDIIMKGTVDESIYKAIATGRQLSEFFKSARLNDLLGKGDNDDE